jgi:hypothetical protein
MEGFTVLFWLSCPSLFSCSSWLSCPLLAFSVRLQLLFPILYVSLFIRISTEVGFYNSAKVDPFSDLAFSSAEFRSVLRTSECKIP